MRRRIEQLPRNARMVQVALQIVVKCLREGKDSLERVKQRTMTDYELSE